MPGVARNSEETEPMVSPEAFRDAIGRFATGVTVITATEDGQSYGTTASAVCSVSLEPPMVLVCMNRASTTGAAVGRVGRFAINILREGQDECARRFALKATTKFDGVPTKMGPYGQPLLDGALAHIEAEVVERLHGGTHTVYLARVLAASGRAGAPLAYFRGRFGGLLLAEDALS